MTTHKFTGDEREAETGLDHTWFRKYSSQFGRWTTADPTGLMAVNLDTPQPLNRYSYVGNMPLSYFDPTGLGSCTAAERRDGDCGHQVNDAVGSWQYCDPMDQSCTATCYVNGFASSCGVALGFLNSGLGVPCSDPMATSVSTCGSISLGSTLLPGGGAVVVSGSCISTNFNPAPNCNITGVSVIGVAGGGGNSSWAWTFTKTFVSNFFSPKFYKQELAEGGCLNTFLEGVDQADVLGPVLNGSPGFAETAIKGQAATVAARYAAGRALTVPLRSSVVRGILGAGEAGATYFAPVYLEAQGSFGLYKEAAAALKGECH